MVDSNSCTSITTCGTDAKFTTITLEDERNVGFGTIDAAGGDDNNYQKTAIVYFYQMQCSSRLVLKHLKVPNGLKSSVICVDRPGIDETSPLSNGADDDSAPRNDCTTSTKDPPPFDIHLMQSHARDVLKVLQHLQISKVFILGICLGHPFAIEVCRQILQNNSHQAAEEEENKASHQHDISICGITLVAPFVSTVCPCTWGVARFGSYFPSSVVTFVGNMFTRPMSALIQRIMTPDRLKNLLQKDEWDHGGWTDDDMITLLELVTSDRSSSSNYELAVGASANWQQVIDQFAVEAKIGLNVSSNEDTNDSIGNGNSEAANVNDKDDSCQRINFPIHIHVSEEDKLVGLASVQWVAKRCYGWKASSNQDHDGNDGSDTSTVNDDLNSLGEIATTKFIVEHKIHSHENMIFLGGPPRNPILLHKICQNWKLM